MDAHDAPCALGDDSAAGSAVGNGIAATTGGSSPVAPASEAPSKGPGP
eukprot:CAMPEP_0118980414 /NCGR_PEP_ID=MMETSP1173-20130426/28289_1 /TAXON_ID=1034831 /ORGANISM="Rhizochromulina marina cf, Strain CCMP1243" /LENGTH=47 /DNA_ID= /DNA_START= /DNA_END= /DNA_ORIENTATION=